MNPLLREALIRVMRQAEFTLRSPAESARITARSIVDAARGVHVRMCNAIDAAANRLDDDTNASCVDCGAPGGTHVSNPCEPGPGRRLGFVDRVSWQRRRSQYIASDASEAS